MNLIQFKKEAADGTSVYSTTLTEKPNFGAYVLTEISSNAPATEDSSKVWDEIVKDIISQHGEKLDDQHTFLVGRVTEESMNVQVAIHFDELQKAIKYAILNDLQVYSDEYGHIETPSSQSGTYTQKQTYADLTSRLMAGRLIKSHG